MGMMLRRHERKPELMPTTNGKPIKKEPKTKSLTETKEENQTYTNYK